MTAPTLVLWDIDGTLIESGGAGLAAFNRAFERIVGRPPTEWVPFAGRTDLEIAADLARVNGVEDPAEFLERFDDELHGALVELVDTMRERGRALPGAREALERLAHEAGVIQSLLTGNVERNAPVKLGAFGLDRFVDFGIGAYGSDHHVRAELPAIARAKAERKHGVGIARERVVLVGDTPLDVAAARASGARAVGVATGPYDEDALERSGAHAVLADLTDTDAVLAALLG
ncbi:MAG: haloacid dehalogenase-like hydrolase [Thermoleophilaceae bacterium]|nr:haloacid dehalogenase-like hydrolase [Thermoleophilaceae bacterium]